MSKQEIRRRIRVWRSEAKTNPNPTIRHEAASFVLFLTSLLERIEREERQAA